MLHPIPAVLAGLTLAAIVKLRLDEGFVPDLLFFVGVFLCLQPFRWKGTYLFRNWQALIVSPVVAASALFLVRHALQPAMSPSRAAVSR